MCFRGGCPRAVPGRHHRIEPVPRPPCSGPGTFPTGAARTTPSLRCIGITLAVPGIAFLLPTTVGAQAPVYLTQWAVPLPHGVTVDGGGNVYVTDPLNQRVQKFTSTGGPLTQWGSAGSGIGQFNEPYGVAVDSSGNVYVADLGNNRVQVFSGSGGFIRQWGTSGCAYLTQWATSGPLGMAVDGSGNVFVTDPDHHRVLKFANDGSLVTEWGSAGTGDGQFNLPFGLGVDGDG